MRIDQGGASVQASAVRELSQGPVPENTVTYLSLKKSLFPALLRKFFWQRVHPSRFELETF